MKTRRLTMAQALVEFLAVQYVVIDGEELPLFAGVFAIFGHGNVAGLGEALYSRRDRLPTFRAHNEQGMTHAAIAYAKQYKRRRMMACTTSIGPGATNMLTAAAVAHVNRLPVLLLPGDVFASRTPDPVLQQLEAFGQPDVSVNDCFRPVSRYFDRIVRPEQLITSLPAALQVLTDPQECGPATLALPQDTQAEACDYPDRFFTRCVHELRRPPADTGQLAAAIAKLKNSVRPLLVAGGGVKYSLAEDALREFAERHGVPVAETQAGKGSLPWRHPQNAGGIGVTGSFAANQLAQQADVVLAVGTRLQDFTTGSRTLFSSPAVALIQLNVGRFDAGKHNALPLVADAAITLPQLSAALGDWVAGADWLHLAGDLSGAWNSAVDTATRAVSKPQTASGLPSDAQVLGAINRAASADDVIVCAAGGLPGEMHKVWRAEQSSGYHVEYGYSCMGYEIAGGLGVKMASPEREVFVVVGDGSYLMLNSELATSVMLGHKLIVVLLDNRGFGCINRLQKCCGGASFNNLLPADTEPAAPVIDLCAHAAALGAMAERAGTLEELEAALGRARKSRSSYVITIDTDAAATMEAGGTWWDVPVPEVSDRQQVRDAHADYRRAKTRQPY